MFVLVDYFLSTVLVWFAPEDDSSPARGRGLWHSRAQAASPHLQVAGEDWQIMPLVKVVKDDGDGDGMMMMMMMKIMMMMMMMMMMMIRLA